MKKLGIIGGMGPLATAEFYRRIVENTKAESDQDHIETIIISAPGIPGRVSYILGESREDPLPALQDVALRLKNAGAEVVVMPCVTAHYFYEGISEVLPQVSFPNLLTELAAELKKDQIRTAGILATDATLHCGLLKQHLKEVGIGIIEPDERERKIIGEIIFNQIKAGKEPDLQSLNDVCDDMYGRGAQTVIIGCTDLSVIIRQAAPEKYIDVLDVLTRTAVRECAEIS